VSTRREFQDALRPLDAAAIRAYLTAHSGLPGPRANLELVAAFADVAAPDVIVELVGSDDEYLASCAAAALGKLVAEGEGELLAALHHEARDPRWRVREGAAMALQRLGDADGAALRDVVAAWAADPDPLVQRAAVAGICEPRLLLDPESARAALDACRVATRSLADRPAADRKNPDVRVLRQGLGYCWSVAVAADPEHGLPAFGLLEDSTDDDVRWIVRENRRKARLQRLLADA